MDGGRLSFPACSMASTAWIGLTPFLMEGLRPPVLPALPWLSRFGEVNVRTYVHDDQGRSGIWFFSLDAARLPAPSGDPLAHASRGCRCGSACGTGDQAPHPFRFA